MIWVHFFLVNTNLGNWQLKDLKGAISSEELAATEVEVTKLLLAEDEGGTVAVSFSVSLPPFIMKAEKYSPEPLVGEAKGLSGRL